MCRAESGELPRVRGGGAAAALLGQDGAAGGDARAADGRHGHPLPHRGGQHGPRLGQVAVTTRASNEDYAFYNQGEGL